MMAIIYEDRWKMKTILIGLLILQVTAHGADMNRKRAVIHHTDSHDVGVEVIDQWHKERGWDGIGYHYLIRANGVVEVGRKSTKRGAHAKGRNHYIGIALTGRDNFTEEQIKGLMNLLEFLKIEQIENHHDKCPGRGLDLEGIAEELNIKFEEVK